MKESLDLLRKWNVLLFVCIVNAVWGRIFNTSYDVFSNLREALSLNSLKDFFVALLRGIFTFSCSESDSFTRSEGDDVCKGIGVCSVSDFLYFLGWTTAVATKPEVLNLWTLLVASRVLAGWMGFLILALELFVFLANCEMMSAVSTILWKVDLRERKLWVRLPCARFGCEADLLLRLLTTVAGVAISGTTIFFWSALLLFVLLFDSCFDFFDSFADRDSFSFSSPNSPFSCQAWSFWEHALKEQIWLHTKSMVRKWTHVSNASLS